MTRPETETTTRPELRSIVIGWSGPGGLTVFGGGSLSSDMAFAFLRGRSEDLVEDLAADIVEEHVDLLGAQLRKPSAEVLALVVDGGVEMRLVDQPSAFSRPARGADDAAPLDLGDLAGDRARGAGSARHHDGLTGPDLADLDHPEIRCQAVDPEQAQRKVGRRAGSDLLHPAEAFAVGHDVVLPTEIAAHDVARREVGMTRFDHPPGGKGLHDSAERHRGLVGIAHHPDALRGVDRQTHSPDQHLSVGGPRDRRLVPENSPVNLPAGRAFKIHWRFLLSVIGYRPLC